MRVCQTCGGRGNPELLVQCSKCQIISEHIYCLDNLVETDDGEVKWACEFCEPRVITLSDSDTETSESSKEPQSAAEDPPCPFLSKEAQRVRNADAGLSTNELQLLYRDLETSHGPKRPMHNNIVGDLHVHDKESEATRLGTSWSDSPETSSSIEDDLCGTIELLPAPIWMGSFQIHGKHSCTIQGMMAHISNEACEEASKVASSFPMLLCLEMVSKINIWPLKFKNMEPTVHNIAVYFFPDHRAERVYDYLVEDVIDHEFAMISRINNVELLIFSSCELPQKYWRLKRKYYLWGIFRRKKKTMAQNQSNDCLSSQHGSINHNSASNLSTQM